MLTDPVFRTFLAISLLTHAVIIMPLRFLSEKPEFTALKTVDLNYVIVKQVRLTEEEEICSAGTAREDNQNQKEGTFSCAGKGYAPRPVTGDIQKTAPQAGPHILMERNSAADGGEGRETFLKYYSLLREKIRAEIRSIPETTEKGTVTLVFTVDPSGRLREIHSVRSGPPPAVKRRVFRGVRRAQPFPPFPEELGTAPLSFCLTVKFVSD